jgi:hypothetical protein
MKVEKGKFDSLLRRMLAQKPEKTKIIKGSAKREPKPIIPKPQSSEPR